jgi:hypothetical protein
MQCEEIQARKPFSSEMLCKSTKKWAQCKIIGLFFFLRAEYTGIKGIILIFIFKKTFKNLAGTKKVLTFAPA